MNKLWMNTVALTYVKMKHMFQGPINSRKNQLHVKHNFILYRQEYVFVNPCNYILTEIPKYA